MQKVGLLRIDNPVPNDRFRQLFIGAQLAAVCGILNLTFFGSDVTSSSHALFFRPDLVAYLVGVIITSSLFIFLDQGRYLKAMTSFLSLWSVVMAFTTWYGGGLNSPLTLSFPTLLIFAALFTELIAFLAICSFLTAAVVFMGFNHIYQWILPPQSMAIDGASGMISAVVLIVLSGYVCWVVGSMLSTSFKNLQQENVRVRESQRVIKKLAEEDALTGLLNRNGAESSYRNLISNIDFEDEIIIGYFVDLDNFKDINDLFDHTAGDQLLIAMGERLRALLPQNRDFACRFGGDEFVLVLRTDKTFDIQLFATKISESFAQPHMILGTEAGVTASTGIAVISDTDTGFNSICKKADMAMYKAKLSGKNQFHIYSDELNREHMLKLNTLNWLSQALNNNLLDLYFQPQINLESNKIESAEALLRWDRGNPEGIEPNEFIPLIESTELIHSIGAWVINEACRACKEWHDTGARLRVAVNVSALQLTRAGFYEVVVDALERHDLPPDTLEIEITEHSLLKEMPLVKSQLAALKELGVSLVIDDFGTGYSNMGYLTRLQIDTLKLDRSFIAQISQSEEHRVIVTAIIKMANVLGMTVVAEGIETNDDRDILLGLNCDFGQGYLWSPAIPSHALIKLVSDL